MGPGPGYDLLLGCSQGKESLCKPFCAQFMPIICIINKWFAFYAGKNKNVEYHPMPPSL